MEEKIARNAPELHSKTCDANEEDKESSQHTQADSSNPTTPTAEPQLEGQDSNPLASYWESLLQRRNPAPTGKDSRGVGKGDQETVPSPSVYQPASQKEKIRETKHRQRKKRRTAWIEDVTDEDDEGWGPSIRSSAPTFSKKNEQEEEEQEEQDSALKDTHRGVSGKNGSALRPDELRQHSTSANPASSPTTFPSQSQPTPAAPFQWHYDTDSASCPPKPRALPKGPAYPIASRDTTTSYSNTERGEAGKPNGPEVLERRFTLPYLNARGPVHPRGHRNPGFSPTESKYT
jgi:hypothetical protein